MTVSPVRTAYTPTQILRRLTFWGIPVWRLVHPIAWAAESFLYLNICFYIPNIAWNTSNWKHPISLTEFILPGKSFAKGSARGTATGYTNSLEDKLNCQATIVLYKILNVKVICCDSWNWKCEYRNNILSWNFCAESIVSAQLTWFVNQCICDTALQFELFTGSDSCYIWTFCLQLKT